MKALFGKISEHIEYYHLIIGSYLLLIFGGAFLLMLPFSVTGPIEFTQALFTSTSATCVTGLAVVDTGTKFTFWGQFIIMALIQTGGLGFMTISTFLLALIGRKIAIKFNLAAQEAISQSHIAAFRMTLRYVFFLVAGFELAGAALLFPVFYRDYPALKSAWLALFHSVAAFCNAGFSLFPDSLNRYAGDTLLNLVIMALIICGGLGFLVLVDIRKNIVTFFRRPGIDAFSLHSKIIIVMTTILILAGFLFIFLTENSGALAGKSFREKVLISLFQSVTPRTAGFNTITTSDFSDATITMIMVLMFIGGASGSTAGGVKVGTAFIVFSAVWTVLSGKNTIMVFKRKIPGELVARSMVIFLLSIILIAACVMLLVFFDDGAAPDFKSKGYFLHHLFETISAFGTVGLSLGVTPFLNVPERLIIIVMMFIGRIGPLLLAITLFARKEIVDYEYPEENIML